MHSAGLLFCLFLAILAPSKIFASGMVLEEHNPRYSCPEMDVDFYGNDIEDVHDVTSWEDCGMCAIFSQFKPVLKVHNFVEHLKILLDKLYL
jgi:hypothetical protein